MKILELKQCFFYSHINNLPAPPPPPRRSCFSTDRNYFKKLIQDTIKTIFELVKDIIDTNLLTKFHEDQTINVNFKVLTRKHVSTPGSDIVQTTETIFELVKFINGKHFLTKFHDDWLRKSGRDIIVEVYTITKPTNTLMKITSHWAERS
ncbi:hypothetical protein DPMN_114621 [Dreissena polymorpha]|uniref:Uncharacterized protein n=1 Tax=Dreissena polymorpha TaxID=45954 RepID=A0A9D4KJV1_DREPO|nr:hypothetical protein DPMN_114621 [Dreissena polymorpha]